MKLSAFKQHLENADQLTFVQQDGALVPAHFHITEAGLVSRHFIDCGGTVRQEKFISFQLWVAQDSDHRLQAAKLLKIIAIGEEVFGTEDLEVEMEYQGETIGRYGLRAEDGQFVLTPKHTDCLAKDNCGVPESKQKVSLSSLQQAESSCCAPGGNCC
jgi:hypothetical protein